jgi:hypothetical protein
MSWLHFMIAMLAGRMLSVGVCAACWENGLHAGDRSPLASLLRRWLWPLLLIAWILTIGRHGWETFGEVKPWAVTACGLLAVEAGGRMGLLAPGRPRIAERIALLFLAAGSYFHPACVFPCVLVAACLSYTVAGWPLSPGYSNLLGFEFIRTSACYLCAAMAVTVRADGPRYLPLACVCTAQVAYYVCHGLAKSALGPHPLSWVASNRVQCLLVNSWLRGWAPWLEKDRVLRTAAIIGRFRVPLCAAAWLLEIGWLSFFTSPHAAAGLLAATAGFHLLLFLATGLIGYSFIASHLAMLWIWTSAAPDLREFLLPSLAFVALLAAFLAWWKPRLLRDFAADGGRPAKLRFSDFSDHLMAWWDSPYMRLYRYEVRTPDGRSWNLPVHRLSPYDTFLTDIHTHRMILCRHRAFDSSAETDAAHARCGVWGLLVDEVERRKWQAWLDSPDRRIPDDPSPPPPWTVTTETIPADERGALPACVDRHNARFADPRYRLLMKWPHFPGEDLVPDVPPVSPHAGRDFAFDAPIRELTIFAVKTLYTGTDVVLWNEHVVGRYLAGETIDAPPESAASSSA